MSATNITTGSIDNTPIGLTTTAPGKFTTLQATNLDNAVIGATTPAAASVTSLNGGQLAGLRNLLINGDARIDQRTNHAAVGSPANLNWLADRWSLQCSVVNKLNSNAAALGGSAAPGFPYGFVVSTNTPYTPAAGDYFILVYRTEGQDTWQLQWGTAAARPATLSFWAQATLAGTYSGAIVNGAGNRSLAFTYTISTANVWTYCTVPIVGDVAGTWALDNSMGPQVVFNYGSGATYSTATSGSWLATQVFGVTGTVQLVTRPANTQLIITGVQLELGTVATPYERRPIGTELALCQRYYQRYTSPTAAALAVYGYSIASGIVLTLLTFSPMRASPTAAYIGTWTGSNVLGGSPGIATNLSLSTVAIYCSALAAGAVSLSSPANGGFDLSAEL
jgi:hypothetical protein